MASQKKRKKSRPGYREEKGTGYIFARISFKGSDGKRVYRTRKAVSKTHAKELREELLKEYKVGGQSAVDGARMTFNDLVEFYKKHYLTEAKYSSKGKKISGMRTYKDSEYKLPVLIDFFNGRLLRTITAGDIRRFESAYAQTPVEYRNKDGEVTQTKERSTTTVNRHLQLLRRMFHIAYEEGWILRLPKVTVSAADEDKRDRVLSPAEEQLLLSVCSGTLRTLVIFALETGMRRGEILSLTAEDIDLQACVINIKALNTKTLRSRKVPISNRLAAELATLPQTGKLFTVSSVKRSFKTATQVAGIADLQFRDLRTTYGTRMIQAGLALAETSKLLGHQKPTTTYKHYLGIDDSTRQRAIEILNRANSTELEQPQVM